MNRRYEKTAKTNAEMYSLLVERGLVIESKEHFLQTLEHTGYHRLSRYMYPFYQDQDRKIFRPGTTFETVYRHYLFDKRLRLLVLDAIEKVEVSVRAQICNTLAARHGPHWYLDAKHFVNRSLHQKLIETLEAHCKQHSDRFLKRYEHRYGIPHLPPAWIVMEYLTFGQVASLFENLRDGPEKKAIAATYRVAVSIFESWLKSLNFVRNCCAHHARLWNRRLPLKPRIPTRKKNRILSSVTPETDKRLYGALSCMLHLLHSIEDDSRFPQDLFFLMVQYPGVHSGKMGFPVDWRDENLWKRGLQPQNHAA